MVEVPVSDVRRREPAFNVPGVILAVCAVLLAIHGLRDLLSNESDWSIEALFAFIPARLTYALDPNSTALSAAYQAATANNQIVQQQIDFLMGEGQSKPWTLLTYAFLHAGWAHVGFNCIWLVVFGAAVARRFSVVAFLLLLVVCAVAGALTQWIADYTSFMPVIGASAAVSGAMGAAVRFVFRPNGEPRQMFDRGSLNAAFRQPALSLREVATSKAPLAFVVFWFVSNFLFGVFPALSGVGNGPIAWQAHVGGFVAGLLLFPLFDPRHAPASDPPVYEDTAEIGPPAETETP